MTTARRLTSLCLLLAATMPAVALAGPPAKPAPGQKPPQAAPAKPPGKEPMDDNQAIVILVILGGLVVVGGGGFVAWRLLSGRSSGSGKGDGRPPEPILPERKYDWELRLTAEQEGAMLRGLQAYRDGGQSLYAGFSEALIHFYDPYMLVSLHYLTNAFMAAGPAIAGDPVGGMRTILEGCRASEANGALHLRKDWYGAPIDGLDYKQFSTLCYDTLTCPKPYLEGTQGSSADEGSGNMTVNVEVGGPMNTFCVDVGRVAPLVRQARQAQPGAPLIELVRPVLQAMSRGELPGAMWTRGGATDAEKDLIHRVVATSQPRQA